MNNIIPKLQKVLFFLFVTTWTLISIFKLNLLTPYLFFWITSTIVSIIHLIKVKDKQMTAILNLMLSSLAIGILMGSI